MDDSRSMSLGSDLVLDCSKDLGDFLDTEEALEVLVVSVDLGPGKRDLIKVYEDDDPYQVAALFAQEHNLDSKLEHALGKHIAENRQLQINETDDLTKSYIDLQGRRCIPKRFLKEEKEFQPNINNRSKQLLSKKKKPPVHDRLYNLQKRDEQQTDSKKRIIGPNRTSGCHHLFTRAIAQQGKKARQLIAKPKIANDECTYRPKINKRKSPIQRPQEKHVDSLIRRGKELRQKYKEIKAQKDAEEGKGYSFKPTVSKRSKELAATSEDKPLYQKLHDDATQKAEKLQKIVQKVSKHECPFTPQIGTEPSTEPKNEFIQRLINEKKIRDEKLDLIRAEKQETHDPKTGQKYFKPKISRGPSEERDLSSSSLWEQLYEDSSTRMSATVIASREQDSLFKTGSNMSNISEGSQAVFDSYKKKQCKKIFDNAFKEGSKAKILTNDNFVFNNHDVPEVKMFMEHIADELNSGLSMNFGVFFNKMDIFLDKLNVTERAAILNRPAKVIDSELKPKPSLTKRSKELSRKRANEGHIVDRLLMPNTAKEEWVRQEQDVKDAEETQKCTFKPSVSMYTISEEGNSEYRRKKLGLKNVFKRLQSEKLGWGNALKINFKE